MKPTIVKVQRPLAGVSGTAPGAGPWIIYAEGRRDVQAVLEADVPAPVRQMMGDDPKAYFAAVRLGHGHWELMHRVEPQAW